MDILRKIADATGPCITIVEPAAERATLMNALREVEQAIPADLRDELIAPVRASLTDFENPHKETVVLLRSADVSEIRFTGEVISEVRTVTDSFELRPLLAAFQSAHEFYLLALSQHRTRLLHCTATSSEEVPLARDTPTSLQESRHSDTPDQSLEKRSGSAGVSVGSMRGVVSGSLNESDRQPLYLHDFFTSIDKAVNAVAKDHPLPVVLVGVESEVAIYRSVNTYSQLAPTAVLGSPDSYKGGEMHSRGLRALSTFVPPVVEKTLTELDKLIGTGHASVHAADIVKASHEGRVAHLFLQSSAEYQGTFDPARGKTKHHSANGDGDRHDLMNDAIRQTILHSGQVTLLTGRQMPNGVPVCAVYRY